MADPSLPTPIAAAYLVELSASSHSERRRTVVDLGGVARLARAFREPLSPPRPGPPPPSMHRSRALAIVRRGVLPERVARGVAEAVAHGASAAALLRFLAWCEAAHAHPFEIDRSGFRRFRAWEDALAGRASSSELIPSYRAFYTSAAVRTGRPKPAPLELEPLMRADPASPLGGLIEAAIAARAPRGRADARSFLWRLERAFAGDGGSLLRPPAPGRAARHLEGRLADARLVLLEFYRSLGSERTPEAERLLAFLLESRRPMRTESYRRWLADEGYDPGSPTLAARLRYLALIRRRYGPSEARSVALAINETTPTRERDELPAAARLRAAIRAAGLAETAADRAIDAIGAGARPGSSAERFRLSVASRWVEWCLEERVDPLRPGDEPMRRHLDPAAGRVSAYFDTPIRRLIEALGGELPARPPRPPQPRPSRAGSERAASAA